MPDKVKSKHHSESDDRSRSTTSRDKRSFTAPLTASSVIILLVISPWLLYLNDFQLKDNIEEELELEHYIQEIIDKVKNHVISNATQLIQKNSMYNSNISKLRT